MLIPLTREKFEQLIPAVATAPQYSAVQGGLQEILQRVLISVLGGVVVLLVNWLTGGALPGARLVVGIIMGFYWLWAPVWLASRRNAGYRRWQYSGFWRGRVLDVFITEDLLREDESFNQRGELVIIENRERRINLEIGDRSGFRTIIKAPLRKVHKLLAPGQVAECLLLSNQPDLAEIKAVTDVYIPSQNLWVGDYPYLRRDFFAAVSDDLARPSTREPQPGARRSPRPRQAPPPRYRDDRQRLGRSPRPPRRPSRPPD
ncbi:MAG: phosphate ABC transporter permease [Cyanobacteria bacterium P01_G01_bin.54]